MRWLVLGLVALAAACSDTQTKECVASYKDLGGPEAPCVKTSSTATSEQCFQKPEICPDLAPVQFCARLAGSDTPFSMLVSNRGEPMMSFKSLKVRGDTRCAFKGLKFDPAEGTSVRGGDAIALRLHYSPTAAGEDHALIEIESDAENYPVLKLAICGKAVTDPRQAGAMNCLECEDKSAAEVTSCE